MKILVIGDVVGKPGRVALLERLQDLKEQYAIDFTTMNAENVAGGFSITPPIAEQLFRAGIDVMTSGNHIFDKHEVIDYIEKQPRLLRPANYPQNTPGKAIWVGEVKGTRVAVFNLIGRVFMQPSDDPFRAADNLVDSLPADVKVRLVDMHAEATSEKTAMGWYLDGRVSAVVGTHTHIPTADARVLPQGTAYVTDVGMVGPRDGCIGMDKEVVLQRFLTGVPNRFVVASGPVTFNSVLVTIDSSSGRATSIQRVDREHS